MQSVEGGGDRGRRNTDAYRKGMDDTAAGTNFGHPSRRYPTVEEQPSYEMGFYEEIGALEVE
jgi:hypothetical protein